LFLVFSALLVFSLGKIVDEKVSEKKNIDQNKYIQEVVKKQFDFLIPELTRTQGKIKDNIKVHTIRLDFFNDFNYFIMNYRVNIALIDNMIHIGRILNSINENIQEYNSFTNYDKENKCWLDLNEEENILKNYLLKDIDYILKYTMEYKNYINTSFS